MPIVNREIIIRKVAGIGCSSDVSESRYDTSSEQYMMFELLFLSFQDLISKDARDREAAMEWFASDEEEYCFSFKALAEAIGTTAEEIKKKIITPVLSGDHDLILRIPKFAKVNRKGVLYDQ